MIGSTLNEVAVLAGTGNLLLFYGYGGIKIMDVSTPAQPVERGRFQIHTQVQSLKIVGTTAYVFGGFNYACTLDRFDISDITRPQFIDHGNLAIYASAVDVKNDLLYAATERRGLINYRVVHMFQVYMPLT